MPFMPPSIPRYPLQQELRDAVAKLVEENQSSSTISAFYDTCMDGTLWRMAGLKDIQQRKLPARIIMARITRPKTPTGNRTTKSKRLPKTITIPPVHRNMPDAREGFFSGLIWFVAASRIA